MWCGTCNYSQCADNSLGRCSKADVIQYVLGDGGAPICYSVTSPREPNKCMAWQKLNTIDELKVGDLVMIKFKGEKEEHLACVDSDIESKDPCFIKVFASPWQFDFMFMTRKGIIKDDVTGAYGAVITKFLRPAVY